MSNFLTFFNSLHRNKKQYLVGAALIALGLGVVTGKIDADRVKVEVTPITFENVDEQLAEGQQPVPAPASNSDSLIGLVSLLLGLNSVANRAAISKAANGTTPAAREE